MKIVAKEVKKALNESVNAQHPHQEWYNYCFDALQESINRGEIGSDDNIDDNIYALIEFVLPNIDELPSDPDDLSEEDYAELEYWLKEAWTNVEFDEEVDESVKGKGKHINESFTLDDDLRQILRDFRTNIDMSRFYKESFIDGENYEPHLQRIIDTYDPYVEEVIGFITCPDSSYAEQSIKHIAEDNEWENGTEANMVVDFLYDLYNWCEEHGLGKEVKKTINENTNENIDMFDYREWKGENGQFLEKFMKEYLKENLSISLYCDSTDYKVSLYLDGEEIGSDTCSNPDYHCGYEE